MNSTISKGMLHLERLADKSFLQLSRLFSLNWRYLSPRFIDTQSLLDTEAPLSTHNLLESQSDECIHDLLYALPDTRCMLSDVCIGYMLRSSFQGYEQLHQLIYIRILYAVSFHLSIFPLSHPLP